MSLQNYKEERALLRAQVRGRELQKSIEEGTMSNHMDEKEFQEAVRGKNWGFIWAAYQYAVNGGEQSEVEKLREQRNHYINRGADQEQTLKTTLHGVEEAARRFGWSEDMNCAPWALLETVCSEARKENERLKKELAHVRSGLDQSKPWGEH